MDTNSGAPSIGEERPAIPFWGYLWVFLGAVLACVIVGAFDPDNNKFMRLDEYSPIQNLQAAILGLAFIFNVYYIFKTRGEARAFWIFILAISFFYLWRELDIDKEYVGARMFSWKYLGQSEEKLSLKYKLMLGITSISLTVLWMGHLLWRPKVIWRATWARIQPLSVFWGGVHFAFFFVAQLWDKATMIRRHLKLNVHDMAYKDPYAEEAMELLGELAFLLFVLTVNALQPRAPREAWSAAREWLRTEKGQRLLKCVGALLIVIGISLATWVASVVLGFRPSEYEYVFVVNHAEGAKQTSLAYLGLSSGQVMFFGAGLATGVILAAAGFWLISGKISKLRLAVGVLAACVVGSTPFLVLEPTTKRNLIVRIELGEALTAERITSLREQLSPATALGTVPPGCDRKLHLGPKQGLLSWELSAHSPEDGAPGIEIRYEFEKGLRTRQRSTFNEFFIHYAEALALEAARDQGIGLEAFSDPSFSPFESAGGVVMDEGEWHRWRRKWIKKMRPQGDGEETGGR